MIAVDLANGLFWAFFALAVVVLPATRTTRAFPWVWAALNVGFVVAVLDASLSGDAVLLAIDFGLFVAVPLGLSYLWIRAIAESKRGGTGLAIALGLVWLVGFVFHKRVDVVQSGLGDLRPVLAAIGYSYVLLRVLDLTRNVAEGRVAAPSLPDLVNYLIPFHMLAAGPIQASEEFAKASVPGAPTTRDALEGVERITLGLTKKFVIAQALDELFLTDFTASGSYFLFEAQIFYLWVYLDFSAYSDIAVGIGRLIGVSTPENFDRPLSARNIIVFWERWHISLSLFARRNIFIPIQLWLVRRSEGKRALLAASIAFGVAFVLVGLWHGLTLGFLAWGAMHAAGLIVCNLYKALLVRKLGRKGVKRYLQNPWFRVLATVITFEYIAFTLTLVKTTWMEGP